MTRTSESVLTPKNGHLLKAALVARISGCADQKEASLDDQEDNGKEKISDIYGGEVDFRVIATKGKGENLDRPELEEIERLYKSGEFDVFVYDELSRLIRGGEAVRLLGLGVDHGTRSISINDGIDTINDTWEQDALAACSDNVAHNQLTSMRIKQKTMNRFKKFGKTAKRPISGYIVEEGATTYHDWRKDPVWEECIREGARILRRTLNGEDVATHFQKCKFPVGPHARNKDWTGSMVLRFYRNTLLKGMPQRGKMATVKVHGSGKRKSRKNPKGPTYYLAPHLAFFDPAEFDELVALLAEANANFRRKTTNGVDVRAGVPRKRTRSFGQHARCWYCGRHYVWGGNGITDNLMCSGSRKWRCWNSIGFNGPLAAEKLNEVIMKKLDAIEGVDAQFREMVKIAQRGQGDGHAVEWAQLIAEEKQYAKEKENTLALVRACGSDVLVLKEQIESLEQTRVRLAAWRHRLESAKVRVPDLPESVDELRSLLLTEFNAVSISSVEFGDFIRQLIPEFHVYLVRLCDGGHLLPRARVRLDLLGTVPDVAQASELRALMSEVITLDLFAPIQREEIRKASVKLEQEKVKQRDIAALLPERPSQAAVSKAILLDRIMTEAGMTEPFVRIDEPPADYAKLRRHKNEKYRFEPLDGYERPTL